MDPAVLRADVPGARLVSVQKRPFSAISASGRGVACAAYLLYASAQRLAFLDLAKNDSFLHRKLRRASITAVASFLNGLQLDPDPPSSQPYRRPSDVSLRHPADSPGNSCLLVSLRLQTARSLASQHIDPCPASAIAWRSYHVCVRLRGAFVSQ